MGLTEKSYEAEVDTYNQVFLTSTEEQWDKRRDAINNLRASLKEAVMLRNFIPVCFMVSTQIIECIKSERTQLCNLAMDYVEEIAKYTKSEFDPLAEYYLSAILKNCGRTNKIIRLKAGNCLESILTNAGPTSWFVKMLNEKNHENKDVRLYVAKGLSIVLGVGHDLAHFVIPIEEAITAAIADASPEVREFGMQSYRQFFQKFPEREQSFRGKLDISTLKTLEKLQARQNAAGSKKNQRPGIAELKKQMKAKMMANKPAEDLIIVADQPPATTTNSTTTVTVTESNKQEMVQSQSGQDSEVNKCEPAATTEPQSIEQTNAPHSSKRPEHTQKTLPHPTRVHRKAIPQGKQESKIPVLSSTKSSSLETKTVNQPMLPKLTPSLRRTNITIAGGAQRVLKKVEPQKKKAFIAAGEPKKSMVQPKAPLQSQNRSTKNPLMKPVLTQPTAKVDSGMPTPNSKRTLVVNASELSKRSSTALFEPTNTEKSRLPKPTRINLSNFSRPTASSNARVNATTSEVLKRKESNARGISVNGKTRKTIGTTGPLRVLRRN